MFDVTFKNEACEENPLSYWQMLCNGVSDLAQRGRNFAHFAWFQELLEPMKRCHTPYPKALISRFHAEQDWYMISIPAVMRKILLQHRNGELFESHHGATGFMSFFKACFGEDVTMDDCILFCNEEHNKLYRKALFKFLHSSQIPKYIDKLEAITRDTINLLPSEGEVNISAILKLHASKVIASILLDYPGPYDEISEAIEFVNMYIMLREVHRPESEEEKEKLAKAISTFQGIFDAVLSTEHAEDSFMYHLMQLVKDEQMTEVQVKIMLFIVFFGGQETISSLLTYSMFAMAQAPEEQEKLIEELRDQEDTSTAALLKNLKGLKRIFAECIRLFPPSYVGVREPRDVVGIEIEESTEEGEAVRSETLTLKRNDNQAVLLFPYLAGRNPEKYPEPERFNPDRFKDTKPKLEWLPFGYGSTSCPGRYLATAEFQIWILRFFEKYKSTTNQESLPIKGYLTLKITEDLFLNLEARES